MTTFEETTVKNAQRVNQFLKDFHARDKEMENKEFYEKYGYRQDEFYHLRKKLIDLKRINPETLEIVDMSPVSANEYRSTPYPYSEKKLKGRKKYKVVFKKKSNGKGARKNHEPRELLTEALTFPVEEAMDNTTIKISVQDFAKIIVGIVREGVVK